MKAEVYPGSCLCGAVKFELAAAPTDLLHCHCRMCQKSHGAVFATFARVPHDAFRFTEGDKELMAGPRAGLFRTLGMNHMVHHRGQLSTYLRLLGGPVPAVYGQSADEKPIG